MNIGELSRLTGLPVKTIRYYSDIGLVPESDRTRANYRQYDHASLARLEFVRTLRELGLDIATIQRVLDRGADLSSVAAAHAEALSAQIRMLKLRRAALRALSRGEPTPQEVDRMNRIAQATAEERRRIIDDFLDSIFADIATDGPGGQFQAMMRSVSADLPDDPSDEQVDAWIELAELVRDESFRARLRVMSERSFGATGSSSSNAGSEPGETAGSSSSNAGQGPGETTGSEPGETAGAPPVMPNDRESATRTAEFVSERVGAAMDAGIGPQDPAAATVVAEIVGAMAGAAGRVDDEGYRRELLAHVDIGYEPRAERYWQLLATINGWPPIPSRMHHWGWLRDALRGSPAL